MTNMPFGKWRGYPISDLPAGYLQWITANIDLREPLRSAILAEIQRRSGATAHVTVKIAAADVPILAEIVDCGVRAAARVNHPDVGGDVRTMQRFNVVAGILRQQIEALEAHQ